MPSFIRFQKSAGSRRISQIVLGGVAAIFLVGAFFSFGGSRQQRDVREREAEIAFVLGGEEVQMRGLAVAVSNMGEVADDPTRQRTAYLQTLEFMSENLALLQDASARGITVNDEDIDRARQEWIADQNSSMGFGAAREKRLVAQNRTEEEFQEYLRQNAAQMDEFLGEQVTLEKYEALVTQDVSVDDDELDEMYTDVKLRLILIEVSEDEPEPLAEDPTDDVTIEEGMAEAPEPVQPEDAELDEEASEPDDEDADTTEDDEIDAEEAEEETPSKAEAEEIITGLLERARAGEDFADLATEESDHWSASNGGEITLKRGDYNEESLGAEVVDAAYSTEIEEISEPILGKLGYQIIKVESRTDAKPEDFEDRKEEFRQQKVEDKKRRAYTEHKEKIKDAAVVEIVNERLRAFKLADDGRHTQALAILTELIGQQEEAEEASGLDTLWYEVAQAHIELGEPEKAELAFAKAIDQRETAALHVELGKLLRDEDRTDEALQEFAAADNVATYDDLSVRYELQTVYREMGETTLADEQQARIENYYKEMSP